MDVQGGVPPSIREHSHTLILPETFLPSPPRCRYIYLFPPPALSSWSRSLSLFSAVWSFDVWPSDAQLTWICLSSWFIFLCRLDISLSVVSTLFYFLLCRGEMFFFSKPGGVSLCDLQFEVRWYHLKVQINYSWTSLTLCGLLTENAAQSFTPVWHQPGIFSLYKQIKQISLCSVLNAALLHSLFEMNSLETV